MTATAPRHRPAWPSFLLGYGVGVLIFLLLEGLRALLLRDPCRGQTAMVLLAPLLLGPGGLGLTAVTWNRARWGLFGLGLVTASLFPALFFAGLHASQLRSAGCAGAYVVFGLPGGGKLGELTVAKGGHQTITVRIGGVRPGNLDRWQLSAQGHDAGGRPATIQAELAAASVAPGTPVTARLTVTPDTPVGQYSLDVHATRTGGRVADGSLTVNVIR